MKKTYQFYIINSITNKPKYISVDGLDVSSSGCIPLMYNTRKSRRKVSYVDTASIGNVCIVRAKNTTEAELLGMSYFGFSVNVEERI
jgi:hypothetical protein